MILRNYSRGFQDYDVLLEDLLILARRVDIAEDDFFMAQFELLCRRFDNIRYDALMRLIVNSDGFSVAGSGDFLVPVSPSDRELVKGDYRIGHCVGYEDIEVGISHRGLGTPTVVGASIGYGKTSLVNLLVEQILRGSDLSVFLLDPKTRMREYRSIAERCDDVIIITKDELNLNVFDAIPGVPDEVLQSIAAQVLKDVWNIYDASFGVLLSHIKKIFKNGDPPNFEDLAWSILAEKKSTWTKRRSYIDTLEVRLAITLGELKNVLSCRRDMFSGLWGKRVIFELGGVSETALKILVSLILFKVSTYQTFNPSAQLSTLVAFEEAQNIFSRHLEHRGITPFVGQLVLQSRSYGLSMIVLAQEPGTKIISTLLNNAGNLLIGHVGGGELPNLVRVLGLTPQQAGVFQHLPPGQFVYKSNFDYSEPLHVQLDYKKFKTPSDAFIQKKMGPVLDELLSRVTVDKPKQSKKTQEDVKPKLSHAENVLLEDIQNSPYVYIQDRYDRLNVGKNSLSKAKKSLERKGLIVEVQVRKPDVAGKPPKLLCITEKAGDYITLNKGKGRGSMLHQFYQYVIRHFAQQLKFTARIEDAGCDVSLQLQNFFIAVEVTLRSDNVLKNIERNRTAGFGEQWILVKTEQDKKKVVAKIKQEDPAFKKSDVRVGLLQEVRVWLRRKYDTVQVADD